MKENLRWDVRYVEKMSKTLSGVLEEVCSRTILSVLFEASFATLHKEVKKRTSVVKWSEREYETIEK